MYGAIASGKESKIYLALNPDGEPIAVKIYLTSLSEFRKSIVKYIDGDLRFVGIKRDTKSIVYTWAQKEFKNLEKAVEVGVRVPKPIDVYRNIVVMEFIGTEGGPSPTLKEVGVKDPIGALKTLMKYVQLLYQKARLVHGDLSEYNVMVKGEELVLFDLGQAVLTSHPLTSTLLSRDLNNLLSYFNRLKVIRSLPDLEKLSYLIMVGSWEEVESFIEDIVTA